MSVFGSIMNAIFKPSATKASPAPASPDSASPGSAAPAGTAPAGAAAKTTTASSSPASSGATAAPAATQVDVAAVLTGLAARKKEKLDWRHSIVDLMKVLDLDSSLSARKELAKELKYSGDTDDSASMNIWLHKQVMIKLAENGGKVPDDLKHA